MSYSDHPPFDAVGYAHGKPAEAWLKGRAKLYAKHLKRSGLEDETFARLSRNTKRHRSLKAVECVTFRGETGGAFMPALDVFSHSVEAGHMFMDYSSLLNLAKYLNLTPPNDVTAIDKAVAFINTNYYPTSQTTPLGCYLGTFKEPSHGRNIIKVFSLLLKMLSYYGGLSGAANHIASKVPLWSYLILSRMVSGHHEQYQTVPSWFNRAEPVLREALSSLDLKRFAMDCERVEFVRALMAHPLAKYQHQRLLKCLVIDYGKASVMFKCGCGAHIHATAQNLDKVTECHEGRHEQFLRFFDGLDRITRLYFENEPRKAYLDYRKRLGDLALEEIGTPYTQVPKRKPTARTKQPSQLTKNDYIWCELRESVLAVFTKLYPEEAKAFNQQ